jgi:hypothetical protein
MSNLAKWIVILGVMVGTYASADELVQVAAPHRPVGVGASWTMAGGTGLEVVYWPDRLGLTATVSAMRAEVEGGAASTSVGQSVTAASLTLSGFVTLTGSERARLAIGLQLGVGRLVELGGPGMTTYEAGMPLRCEVFLTDQLSLHADVGFHLRSSETPGAPTTTLIGTSGSALGTGGFTYYF